MQLSKNAMPQAAIAFTDAIKTIFGLIIMGINYKKRVSKTKGVIVDP